MQTSKQDRQTPPSREVHNFQNALSEMLSGVGFCFSDAYWLTVIRPWNKPTDETSYQLHFESGFLTLNFQIFDSQNYFVILEIEDKSTNQSFSLFNFCEVTGFPPFKNQNLRHEAYLSLYLKYLEDLFIDPVFQKILNGQFWFNFWFDMRDWATTPGLITDIREMFFKALKNTQLD